MPVLLLLLSLVSPFMGSQTDPAGWTRYPVIAHGMGEIGGTAVSNSYDAFVSNYAKGFRVFETDLQLTSDGYLVARHDWGAYLYGLLGQDKPDGVGEKEPIPLETFKSLRIDGKYRPLEFADIVKLLEAYPDAYLVTDTKEWDPDAVRRKFGIIAETAADIAPEVLKRIVPQIYDQDMYETLEDVYPFYSYIYTLYESDDSNEEVVEFVKETPKIKAVAMPQDRVTQPFASELKRAGVKTYVHTVNDYFVYESLRGLGIDGIYTDRLAEKEIRMAELRYPGQAATLAGIDAADRIK
ncbi:phosphatidylinositol-specific phospholipase C/glycerophosphodiester phosphodiesterase family protein [Cohnella candidum]|uniref:Glycerophosphodiester phosphodiesterase n=1 Tax=Cohnella candidum TaxID=2674991 RepID=A0A3G3K1I8_9BACL|nr:phosphatidylinositol-specific phospholipase C/glycerophosphodiester phosphodiesterase family protein [Cohnella candidum]AYQ73629.1 glycerophosphodiester phosphodiesterase [Cohnella candidum]